MTNPKGIHGTDINLFFIRFMRSQYVGQRWAIAVRRNCITRRLSHTFNWCPVRIGRECCWYRVTPFRGV